MSDPLFSEAELEWLGAGRGDVPGRILLGYDGSLPDRELKALDHERTGRSTKNTKPHPFSPVKLDQEDHRCKLLSYHYNKCIGVGLLWAGKCLSLKTWKKYHGVDNSGYLDMEAFMNLI